MNNVTDTVNLLRSLGFTIHPDKSVFIPTQNSIKITTTLTEERKEKIYDNCSSLLQSNKNITVRELAQTIGTFVAAFTAVPLGQLFYRHLENSKVESLRRAYGDFDKKAFISTEAKTELKWWKENIKSSFAPIKVQPVHYAIYSDASLEGCGGTDGEIDIGEGWGDEKVPHINSLELLVAFLCLKSFYKKNQEFMYS